MLQLSYLVRGYFCLLLHTNIKWFLLSTSLADPLPGPYLWAAGELEDCRMAVRAAGGGTLASALTVLTFPVLPTQLFSKRTLEL